MRKSYFIKRKIRKTGEISLLYLCYSHKEAKRFMSDYLKPFNATSNNQKELDFYIYIDIKEV